MCKTSGYSLILCLSLVAGLALAHEGHHPEKALKGKQKQKMDKAVKEIGLDYQRNVEPIFRVSCFNCHSNSTQYPWYHRIPGLKGMIDDDVTEAKKHIDMSNGYPFKGHGNLESDLKAIAYQVDKGKMPPFKYRMMHWKSGLTEKQEQEVEDWTERGLDKLFQASQ